MAYADLSSQYLEPDQASYQPPGEGLLHRASYHWLNDRTGSTPEDDPLVRSDEATGAHVLSIGGLQAEVASKALGGVPISFFSGDSLAMGLSHSQTQPISLPPS